MPVIANTPNGPVLVDETTGDVLDSSAAAARARQAEVQGVNNSTSPAVSNPPPDPNVTTPPKRVVKTTPLPGGLTQIEYDDGTYDVQVNPTDPLEQATKEANLARIFQLLNAGGGGSASAGVSRQNFLDNLAYQKTQDQAKAAADQAAVKQRADEFAQSQDLERGKTLLGLGSRPDTLIRYLYAIRGQLPPQAPGGQGVTLPGYSNIFATPQQGATAPSTPTSAPQATPALAPPPTSLVPPSPVPITNPAVVPGLVGQTQSAALASPTFQQQVNANAYNKTVAPGQTASAVGPGGIAIYSNQPGVPSVAPSISNTNPAAFDPTKIPGYDPVMREKALNTVGNYVPGQSYAKGGVIPEPVVGQGVVSGQPYSFGEKGPETVVPGTAPDIMDIVKMFMDKGKSGHAAFGKQLAMMLGGMDKMDNRKDAGMKMPGSYADGGTIGYNPEVFNPSGLGDIVNRGYNSTPDVPLFPNVGIATGGTSLVPSTQRLNSLLPSEQQNYSGFLQDEMGVQPEDVFSLAQKLAPKVRGLSTPRYI